MAKKTDEAVKDLAKEVKKLRKENEKLAKTLERVREDQAGSHREILALLEERLTVQDAAPATHDVPAVEDSSPDGEGEEKPEAPEVTEAAERRAKDLGVDLSAVKGSGSGGRVLVKDVEAAADGAR